MRKHWFASLLSISGTLGACAHQAPPRELITPQSHLGLGEGFGPGIVAASAGSITYKLDNRAYVIVLRVMEDGTIEQLLPSGSGVTRATPKGTYPIEATPPPAYPPAPQVPAGIVYGPCVSVSDTAFTKPDPDCWTPDRALMASDPRPVPRRGRDVEAGYWLVITSDVATSAAAVDTRLRALDLEDGTLLHTVRQIPAALIGGHTTNWSAFYVGFAVIPTATAKH